MTDGLHFKAGEHQDESWLQSMIKSLADHPLCARFIQSSQAARFSHYRPADAQGFRLVTARLMAGGMYPQMIPGVPPTKGDSGIEYPVSKWSARLRVFLTANILQARTYIFREEVTRLIDDMPLPPHIIGSGQTPFPASFWVYDDFRVLVLGDVGNGLHNRWANYWSLLLEDDQRMLMLEGLNNLDQPGLAVVSTVIPYGLRWPDDFGPTNDFNYKNAEQVLKRLAFLNSDYIDRSPLSLNRAERRELVRRGILEVTGADSLLNTTIAVRRKQAAEAAALPRDEAEDQRERRYKHTWWVSGHIRAQWYSTIQAHRPKWIAPYLKGPEGAPLIEHTYDVRR